MSWLIRLGIRRGWRNGVVNGNKAWLYAGAAALLLRMLGRAFSKEEAVVYREVLQAGERIVITHEPRV
ncbi:MAG: hypothetical protein QOF81_3053 [Acidimicrobiaceae bacterium]|jgi:hypothetical protein|nr:hypothetical protein [Acidimicrobiaceae bacterium]MDQ1417440.1 hypothetical protein [Acidimicrobiaceae bacterium]